MRKVCCNHCESNLIKIIIILPLALTDPINPRVSSPNDVNLYWTLNDTGVSIRCDGTGDPPPQMRWLKNGKEVHGTNNIHLDEGNGSLTITFLVAEYNVHGSYLCIAENLANKAEKMFNVFIEGAQFSSLFR